MKRFHRSVSIWLVALGLFCLQAVPTIGEIILTSCDENSVRMAIAAGGSIRFECDGVVRLTSPLSVVTNTTLDASGRDVTISGEGLHQILRIQTNLTLRLVHLTLANGHDNGNASNRATIDGLGGAIFNSGGALEIEECFFQENKTTGAHLSGAPPIGGAAGGGDIYCENGSAKIFSSSFRQTVTTAGSSRPASVETQLPSAQGGSIWVGGGTLSLSNVVFSEIRMVGGTNTSVLGGDGGPCLGGIIYATNSTVHARQTGFFDYACMPGKNPTPNNFPGDVMGGCLYLADGTTTLTTCYFLTNSGSARLGGAIYNTGSLVAKDCSFGNNRTQAYSPKNWPPTDPRTLSAGGAIHNAGTAILAGCSFFHNGSTGSAAFVPGSNTAKPGGTAKGGAIYNSGTIQSINCTFYANDTIGGLGANGFGIYSAGGDAFGGAFYTLGHTDVRFATFASNSATGGKGGGFISPNTNFTSYPPVTGVAVGAALFSEPPAQVTVWSSIFGHSLGSANNAGGEVIGGSFNLSIDSTPTFDNPSNQKGMEPLLGNFGNYGDPTFSIPLLWGSPAIDAASKTDSTPTDQRGRPRPPGAADAGSFEQTFNVIEPLQASLAGITLSFFGSTNWNYVLEATQDFLTWTPLASEKRSPGEVRGTHPLASPLQFYRVRGTRR